MCGAAATLLLFAGCNREEGYEVDVPSGSHDFSEVINVSIPTVSIIPGMTLTIDGGGFTESDKIFLENASSQQLDMDAHVELVKNSVTETNPEGTTSGMTFVVPSTCATGAYKVLLVRKDGTNIELGQIELTNQIALQNVSARDEYPREGLVKISGQGFYATDSIRITTLTENLLLPVTVAAQSADGGSISFWAPVDITGMVDAVLVRGTATIALPSFVVDALLPTIGNVVVPSVSLAPGMTLTIALEGVVPSDLPGFVLRNGGSDIQLPSVPTLNTGGDSLTLVLPSTLTAGSTYELYVARTDNTTIKVVDLTLSSSVTVTGATQTPGPSPKDEPVVITGTGFYPGDRVRFVCVSPAVDVQIATTPVLTAGVVTGIRFTPPTGFVGTATVSVVRGTLTGPLTTVELSDEIGNVAIPSFSIVPGMTLAIGATNADNSDAFVLRPSLGPDIALTLGTVTTSDFTVTIPSSVTPADYTLVATNRTPAQSLGTLTVAGAVVIDGAAFSGVNFAKGSTHPLTVSCSQSAGSQTFAPGDKVQLVVGGTPVLEQTVTLAANGSFGITLPASLDYTADGAATVRIVRGTVPYTVDLGTVKAVELHLFDYFEGGIVIAFSTDATTDALHGEVVNIYNGLVKQRGGDGAQKRGCMGSKYATGDNNGTASLAQQAMGMGDQNTKAFIDFEISKGGVGLNILTSHNNYQSMIPLRIQGYPKPNPVPATPLPLEPLDPILTPGAPYTVTDKLDGAEKGGWYVPSIETLLFMAHNADDVNLAADINGGEPLPGTSGYLYTTAADGYAVGSTAWGNADGMVCVSSNCNPNNPLKVLGIQYYRWGPSGAAPTNFNTYEADPNVGDFAFRLCRKF
ncbi:hypothetical protein FACS1894159_00590 [Bacteroidia bacterium]|nr:hypothetical protein FACS1894159_00590 [Bacteroidia bacterium]